MWRPFRADLVGYSSTQGVALGWYVRPFQGCSMTRKTGMRPRRISRVAGETEVNGSISAHLEADLFDLCTQLVV
jgi:hypothetical protein